MWGLVTGACLCRDGQLTSPRVCLDVDARKIRRRLNEGGIPIHEPGC
jgi:UDP-glucose 6-dehydrogenase